MTGYEPNRGRERCPCGKEIIATRTEALRALRTFRQRYGAKRGSVYRCSLGHPYYHITKGERGNK